MAKFVANPVKCDAFEIVTMGTVGAEGDLALFLDDGSMRYATPEMMSRMKPKVGDYWVVQEADGYVYLNPKEVFERKYSRVTTASN